MKKGPMADGRFLDKIGVRNRLYQSIIIDAIPCGIATVSEAWQDITLWQTNAPRALVVCHWKGMVEAFRRLEKRERDAEVEMTKRFTMTEEEFKSLQEAARTPGVFLGGPLAGFDPARAASEDLWKKMGQKYGFRWQSVRPVAGQPQTVFEAEEV